MKISHLEWITGVTFTVKNDEERKTMIFYTKKTERKRKDFANFKHNFVLLNYQKLLKLFQVKTDYLKSITKLS